MRRVLMLLLVAVWLLPEAGQAAAQATPDQLNRLSLEALTTPAPGGNPGPTRYHRAYQRSFSRSVSRRSYATRGRRSYRYAARSTPRHVVAARYARARTDRPLYAAASGARHLTYRRASYTVRSTRPTPHYHRRPSYRR